MLNYRTPYAFLAILLYEIRPHSAGLRCKDPNEVTQKTLQAELGTAFKLANPSAQQIIEAGKQKKYFKDLIGKILPARM